MELAMNGLAPVQTVAAQKAAFESMFGLRAKALESFEKLVDLNAQTVKSTLAEHQDSVTKVFALKDAQEFFCAAGEPCTTIRGKSAGVLPPGLRNHHQHPSRTRSGR